jgi:hypothetical protein
VTGTGAGETRPIAPGWRGRARRGVRLAQSPAWAACGAALATGAWLRLWMVAHTSLQSDQATTGLMAEQILHGHFSALFWGQHYGGAEPYVVAGMFALFGHSAYVVNVTATVLVAAATVLLSCLGRLVSGRTGPAAVAACIAWVWPWAALWSSTRSTGFRAVTLACGVAVIVAAYRVALGGSRTLDWAALGIAAGVGLWSSVEIAYFAVPVVALFGVAITRRTVRLRPAGIAVALGALLLGAAPWIADNIETGFATLRTTAIGATTTYGHRLHLFFTEMLPVQLGLKTAVGLLGQRTPVHWVFGATASLAIFGLYGVVILTGLVSLAVLARPEVKALATFVIAFPFVYALLPPTDNWYDGRYGVLLPGVLVVVVVSGVSLLVERVREGSTGSWRATAVPVDARGAPAAAGSPRARHAAGAGPRRPYPVSAVLAAALATCLLTASTVDVFSREAPRARLGQSLASVGERGADGVARVLEAHRVRTVVADYWPAYVLDFVSGGDLRATPLVSLRVPSTFRRVMASRHAAWLFVGPRPGDVRAVRGDFQTTDPGPATIPLGWFTSELRQLRVPYSTVVAGPMVAVRPTGHSAAWLLAHLDPAWATSPLNRHHLVPVATCHCGTSP